MIERVTYFNAETGFCVLKVKVKGRSELTTVIGSVPAVCAGEWLKAEGIWIIDKEHGPQLKADHLQCIPPSTREGIEKYLGSGMVKGIGPAYAKKLVDCFGEKIFEIIDLYSARLEEVDGIGPGRRRKIKEAWTEQKFIREIMVFLHSHGVSTSRAVRIYKTYGETAIETVRANPYLLARDIQGIGFKTADAIAQKLGIPLDSIERARAGVEHALLDATGSGHCALPRERLIENAQKLLGVKPEIVQESLGQLLAQGELVAESIHGEELVFPRRLLEAEKEVAARVRFLATAECLYPAMGKEKALVWAQEKLGVELAPTQRKALLTALSRRIVIITGGPGVGKTTLVKSLLAILRAKKLRCVLCAPTGRAAKRLSETTGLEARTIHRMLGAGRESMGSRQPIEGDVLVVDEVSMIDVVLFQLLVRALPPAASLVLVGDVDQLPSVGPGTVLRDLIQSGILPVMALTEVFRQAAGSQIITTAHQVNQGLLPEFSRQPDADFHFIDRSDPAQITTTLVEMVRTRIPKKFGLAPGEIQILCPMNRGSLGARELNSRLQNELNPENGLSVERYGWQFRVGDRVIQTQNNYDKDVFNGDIGKVTAIDLIEQEVEIQFDQRKVLYDFGALDEVSLAYAITIHKSQGSEFPGVVIPIAMQQYVLLQRNLLYTGITRGRKIVVIIGERKAFATAVRNAQSRHRYGGLEARLAAPESS